VKTEIYYWLVHLTIAVLATLASAEGNHAQQHIPTIRLANLNTSISNTEPVKSKSLLTNSAATATTNWFFVQTNNNAGSSLVRLPRAPLPESGLWTNHPAPGVYEAAPYKGIVIVPDTQLDDPSTIVPADTQPLMPIVTPELELVSRKPE
jgi:hypothetical protein